MISTRSAPAIGNPCQTLMHSECQTSPSPFMGRLYPFQFFCLRSFYNHYPMCILLAFFILLYMYYLFWVCLNVLLDMIPWGFSIVWGFPHMCAARAFGFLVLCRCVLCSLEPPVWKFYWCAIEKFALYFFPAL